MARKRLTRVKRAAESSAAPDKTTGLKVGEFSSHIIGGAAMCAVLLLVSAALSALIRLLALFTEEQEFHQFAHAMHLFLLWSDGCLFVWWVLYSIVKRVREWR